MPPSLYVYIYICAEILSCMYIHPHVDVIFCASDRYSCLCHDLSSYRWALPSTMPWIKTQTRTYLWRWWVWICPVICLGQGNMCRISFEVVIIFRFKRWDWIIQWLTNCWWKPCFKTFWVGITLSLLLKPPVLFLQTQASFLLRGFDVFRENHPQLGGWCHWQLRQGRYQETMRIMDVFVW